MKITIGTVEHIKQLAISRQNGRLAKADCAELFDSIDCLDLDELSELYAIARVGELQSLEQYDVAFAEAKGRGFTIVEHLFGLSELGKYLISGTFQLKLG